MKKMKSRQSNYLSGDFGILPKRVRLNRGKHSVGLGSFNKSFSQVFRGFFQILLEEAEQVKLFFVFNVISLDVCVLKTINEKVLKKMKEKCDYFENESTFRKEFESRQKEITFWKMRN